MPSYPVDLPEPPYYAVIFPSQRPPGDPDDGYAAMAARMVELARQHREHVEARRRGRNRWYADWAIRVCRVERAYAAEL